MKTSRTVAASSGTLLLASVALTGALTGPAGAVEARSEAGTHTQARLNSLNNSGVQGRAVVDVQQRRLKIRVNARGLVKGMPHAQHIHFGAQARNECPTVADDSNRDFRLTTAEGLPAYGPIRVSLTTSGDTSAASGLAVSRFPTAPMGKIDYHRQTRTSREVARAIRHGEGVVVVHGVDYNNNGKYDFGGAGASELDPSLPAEATDPAACGVLRHE